jgi:penicillin-binding protein 1C
MRVLPHSSHPRSGTALTGRRRRWRNRAISILCVSLGLLAAAGAGIWWRAAQVPALSVAIAEDLSKSVTDRNGRLLRAYITEDGYWRLPVANDDIDPRYVAMLLAFEDRRFDQHFGVDPLALVRAAVQAIRHRRIVSGGSTLTMQVARLLAREHPKTLVGKFEQMVRAVDLERRFSKAEILNLYFRLAPFGGNIEGVRAASLAYFGREPNRLSVAEAALLVALPQSPELRRPDRSPKAARHARDHVLGVAAKRGVISAGEHARAQARPVPRLRQAFPQYAPHLSDALVSRTSAPLETETTIDRVLQTRLEALAATAARRAGPQVSVAILAAEHATGEVRAYVGSPGLLDSHRRGAIDMIHAIRSPGSTLKPLIYGLGFDDGTIHPRTLIDDVPTRFGAYAPKNFDGGYQGTVTITEALASSLNVPSVKVLDRIGPVRLIGRLQSAGLALTLPEAAKANLSVALGGLGMSLDQLVAMYVAIARGGEPIALRTEPQRTQATADHDAGSPVAARLVSERTAHWLTQILRQAPPPPNARRGRIAFKTGTSYGYRDAWSIGYDGRHVIGVWIGRADGTPVPGLIGRTAAAPILFDAFTRVTPERAGFAVAKTAHRLSATAALPEPLRRFERNRTTARNNRFHVEPVRISFPPDQATLAARPGTPVLLRAEGGDGALNWLVDGRPVTGDARTMPLDGQLLYTPTGPGFVEFSVVDGTGQIDRLTVRFVE